MRRGGGTTAQFTQRFSTLHRHIFMKLIDGFCHCLATHVVHGESLSTQIYSTAEGTKLVCDPAAILSFPLQDVFNKCSGAEVTADLVNDLNDRVFDDGLSCNADMIDS